MNEPPSDPGLDSASEPSEPTTSRALIQRASAVALADGMRRAWATKSMLAALAGAYLLVGWVMYLRGNATIFGIFLRERGPRLLTRCGAQNAANLDAGEYWRLVSTIFLHGNGIHILFNGVALMALGRLCESVYGPVRFLWLFLLSGVAGAVLSWQGGNQLSVGASGGIFGLLGAAIVFGWRYRHDLPDQTSAFFRIKLLPWVGLNLFIGVMLPALDNLGHTGGLLGGAALALVLGNRVIPGEETGGAAHASMTLGVTALICWALLGVAGLWI